MRFSLLILAFPCVAAAQQRADILIRGGTLIDGNGTPARRADVAVTGARISFVGDADAARVTATRTIDATGLIVAPGFVDPHTHAASELSSATLKGNVNYLMQGVTTVVTNNDGGGPVNIADQIAAWTRGGIGTNAAVYIGQGSVRRAVMGASDRAPTAVQLDSMKKLVARAMDEGAIGLSTGLFYAPGSFSSTEEVIALARVAAAKGGRYDSHIRDESSYGVGLLAAIEEVVRIARESRMPAHVSHIKALGVDVWGKSDSVIAIMKKARAEGLEVSGSVYPYTASGSSVGASLFPRWAEAGGRDSVRARLADSATRRRIIVEMEDNLRRRGGASSLLITGGRDSTIRGKRLGEVASMWSVGALEAAIRIILAGDASVASFNMQDADILNFMRQDFISIDSDGSDGHPRKYGAFPRFFRMYVREKGVMPLPQAVRQATSASAKMLGIWDRGVIERGKFADIVVFDANAFTDRATYEQPAVLAEGMKFVLVNGTVAVDRGAYTGALAGRVLRKAN